MNKTANKPREYTKGEIRKKYRFYIGIDTGVKTGFAVWNRPEKQFYDIRTLHIHQAMEWIKVYLAPWPGQVLVRVEDARKRKWFGNADSRMERSGAGIREGIGSVKRDAKIFEDFLTELDVDFEMVAPKNNRTKLTSQSFAHLTGWKERTTEHSRDAAMLVYGL